MVVASERSVVKGFPHEQMTSSEHVRSALAMRPSTENWRGNPAACAPRWLDSVCTSLCLSIIFRLQSPLWSLASLGRSQPNSEHSQNNCVILYLFSLVRATINAGWAFVPAALFEHCFCLYGQTAGKVRHSLGRRVPFPFPLGTTQSDTVFLPEPVFRTWVHPSKIITQPCNPASPLKSALSREG